MLYLSTDGEGSLRFGCVRWDSVLVMDFLKRPFDHGFRQGLEIE